MKLSCSAKKKQPPPTQAPRQASREVLREASRQAGLEAQGGKPSKTFQTLNPFKTLQTLQTPSPTGTPGPRPLLNQAPQGQGHSSGFLLAFKAAVCQPANTPNAPKSSKRSKTIQTLQAWRHALSRWPKAMARKESSSTQQNHIAPREARTPDLEANSLTL